MTRKFSLPVLAGAFAAPLFLLGCLPNPVEDAPLPKAQSLIETTEKGEAAYCPAVYDPVCAEPVRVDPVRESGSAHDSLQRQNNFSETEPDTTQHALSPECATGPCAPLQRIFSNRCEAKRAAYNVIKQGYCEETGIP